MEDWHELVVKSFEGRELPTMVLLGNKVDLNHMQAVKAEQHEKFSKARKMKHYFCSAKTGDQVNSVFYTVAADLSGVTLSKQTLDILQKKVRAEIIDHGDKPSASEVSPQ